MKKGLFILLGLYLMFSSSLAFAVGNVTVTYKDGTEQTFGFVKKVVEVYDDFGNLVQVRIVPIQPNTETVLNYRNLRSYRTSSVVNVERRGMGPYYNRPYYTPSTPHHQTPYYREFGGYHPGFGSYEEYKKWKQKIIKESR